jgi:Brp/Blh family beta-carotene 15,15'-monooxygenase
MKQESIKENKIFGEGKDSSLKAPIILLIVTLGLCSFQLAYSSFYSYLEYSIFFLAFFCIGIPHGAVDHLLETGKLNTGLSYNYILSYLAVVFLFFILWQFFPNVSVIIFLIFSSIHFGQTDMKEWFPNLTGQFKNLFWGSLVLGIILFGHISEVNVILENMQVFRIPLNTNEGVYFALSCGIIAFIWAAYNRSQPMAISITVLLLSIYLPLLSSFGLYFLGQHSVSAWSHLRQVIHSENLALFLKALPMTIGALLLFLILLVLMRINVVDISSTGWVTTFFVFVSCISLPHALAMNGFYRKHFKDN